MPSTYFYIIKQVPLTNTAWTPISAPQTCSGFSIRAPVDIYIRTDEADATTQDTIPAGIQEYRMPSAASLPAGVVFVWLQAVAGSTTAIVKFIE
jgi:hypothetical protein